MSNAPPTITLPRSLYLKTRLVMKSRRMWERLGNLETAILQDQLESRRIESPLYVCGLARAGTTITTEILSQHPDVASHSYGDFPFVYTPYWRNWIAQRSRLAPPKPTERSHGDRIQVTIDSPEAIEEVLWMHFFPDIHDPSSSNVLDGSTSNPAFERFYREHIAKLLLVRERNRYLAKGNYNITRLEYLLRLFPNARFIVLIRDPIDHIASLFKQHRLFLRAAESDGRIGGQLAASGHFEFGPLRNCIHFGNEEKVRTIESCWREGREAEGWAHYWDGLYADLAARLKRHEELSRATLVVDYDTMCRKSQETLSRILDHCMLSAAPFGETLTTYEKRLTPPDYYRPDFTREERESIERITASTRERFAISGKN